VKGKWRMASLSEVYVVDDDEAIRRSLTFLLRTAGIPSQSYDSALSFLRDVERLAPGCIITDIRMPGMDGLEMVRRLKEKDVPHPVIVITGHGDIPLAVEAMKAGAIDFIEKPFRDEVLLAAVRTALNVEEKASANDAARRRYQDVFANLSPREQEVLRSVVEGKTNKVIAYDFGISPRTVEVHRANMMMKSGARSLSELVRMALLAGI
jgi:two-component system response regulator FixJ